MCFELVCTQLQIYRSMFLLRSAIAKIPFAAHTINRFSVGPLTFELYLSHVEGTIWKGFLS